MSEQQYDIAVIGAGPGGYAAAFKAADLGMRVALIDNQSNPGGVCLYRGCIPTKALLHIAKVKYDVSEASKWGLGYGEPTINLDKIRDWKDSVVQKLTGGLGQLSKRRNIFYIKGLARFISPNTLSVSNGDIVQSKNIIIATGSSISMIPGISTSDRIWDSDIALKLDSIPKRLLIIGGGYIGMEMSMIYASLGSKVTIVEMMSEIMSGMDRDLVAIFEKQNRNTFEQILINTKITSISESGSVVNVVLEDNKGKLTQYEFDVVLISIGRKPNSENLGLESVGVKTDKKGFIVTDLQMKTNVEGIYAIGDITGSPLLAHKASHQAKVAVEVINGQKSFFEPKSIPGVVYTNPEIATCGLTEQNAKILGIEIVVTSFPWAASGRSVAMGNIFGLTKLICEPNTGRILGGGIAGPNAGELISEINLAVEMGATADDLALTIHPHPTLSETIMEAAEEFAGSCTHMYKPKR